MFARWMALAAILAAVGLGCIGCEPVRQEEKGSVLNAQDPEFVLCVAIDLSGSFAEMMSEGNGRAYRFLLAAIDRYFRGTVGDNVRIIIAQLSATDRPLLWDGSPRRLRKDFPNAQAFREFLLTHSNPNGSRLHDGINDELTYLMSMPGVASGKTKSCLLVLSDMEDNIGDPKASEQRLARSLAEYAKVGGVCGFYWVEHPYVPVWRKHLRESGMKSWVVESEIVADPSLPSWD